jgi:hypothetical protein
MNRVKADSRVGASDVPLSQLPKRRRLSRGGSEQILQMGLGLTVIAGPAEPTAPERLGVGGFYARSRGIGGREP